MKPRKTWYSDQCVNEWKIKNDPGYMREMVYKRDRGVCAICGINATQEFKRIKALVWAIRGFSAEAKAQRKAIAGKWTVSRSTGWDCDHVTPVIEGGGQCTLDNLRTLCHPCHKDETAALAARRAEARRISQQPMNEPTCNPTTVAELLRLAAVNALPPVTFGEFRTIEGIELPEIHFNGGWKREYEEHAIALGYKVENAGYGYLSVFHTHPHRINIAIVKPKLKRFSMKRLIEEALRLYQTRIEKHQAALAEAEAKGNLNVLVDMEKPPEDPAASPLLRENGGDQNNEGDVICGDNIVGGDSIVAATPTPIRGDGPSPVLDS